MKCPYCNKELGEKNECITSTCYAFEKVFPRYDLEEGKSSKNDETLNNTKENFDDSNINSKLEEIKKNATNQKSIPKEDYTGTSTNAGLYILIAIIILLVIGFIFF